MMALYKLLKIIELNELMDVLEETEGKAIIWANYQYDITEIINNIKRIWSGILIVDYYGLTPQEERQDNIRKFQNDPKCRFIIGNAFYWWLWNHFDRSKHCNLLF